MKRHNIPPEHFTTMLQRLESSRRSVGDDGKKESNALEGYLSTHPATQERVRMFGKEAQ